VATAHEARRVWALSARLVRTMGTRAPSTMPAARMMGHSGEAIDAALSDLGLRPDVRAEDVPLSGLRAVAAALGVVR